jgi:O-antigen/teichoic acid export membrane protein
MLGVALISILSPLLTLGIPTGAARQLAHSRERQERYSLGIAAVKMVLPLALASGIALYLAAPFISPFLGGPAMTVVIRFLSIYLAISMVSGTFGALFQGQEDVRPNTLFGNVLFPLLLLAFLVAFFSVNINLTAALLAYVCAAAASLGGFMIYMFKTRSAVFAHAEPAPSSKYASRTARNLFLFSLPLTMMGVASVVTGNVDSLALGHWQTAGLVGTYNAVLTMSRLLTLGVLALAYIMLPVAARLHATGDLKELGLSYATMTKWILCIFMPLYVIFMFLPSTSLLLVYGSVTQTPAYATAATVLRVAATAGILSCLLGPATAVLTGLGKIRLLFYDTLACAVIDVAGSLILVPLWGIYGAVAAFAVATAALPLMAVIQTHNAAGVSPFRAPAMKPLVSFLAVAGLMIGIPVYVLHYTPGWILLVPLYFFLLLIYLGLILATRSMEREDAHLLGVLEGYLGRPLPLVRRLIHRFVSDDDSNAKDL